MARTDYLLGMQYFAIDMLERDGAEVDLDAAAAQVLDQFGVTANEIAAFDEDTAREVSRVLLERAVATIGPQQTVARGILAGQLTQHGGLQPVKWGLILIGVIIALRVESVDVENGRLVFDTASTPAIVEMVKGVLSGPAAEIPKAVEEIKDNIDRLIGPNNESQ